jgi:hypothetical protein
MSAHGGPTAVAAATTRQSTTDADPRSPRAPSPTGPSTPSASFARLNAVKFTAFISIIMHTGGPSPRYAPLSPSSRASFVNEATNPAPPGTPRGRTEALVAGLVAFAT